MLAWSWDFSKVGHGFPDVSELPMPESPTVTEFQAQLATVEPAARVVPPRALAGPFA